MRAVAKPVVYVLEIYAPDDTTEVVGRFEASSPFASISVGELIQPAHFERIPKEGHVLKVVGVEHGLWELKEHLTHQVMVFTTNVEDDADSRGGRNAGSGVVW